MAVPVRVAVDASVAPDAGRLHAILGLHQEEVLDSHLAADRDFLSALAELERLVLLARWHVRKAHRVQRPRDAWQRVVFQSVLQAALVQQVAPLQTLLALLQAQTDESELLQAQSLQVRLASRLEASPLVHEPAPYVAPEQRPRVLLVRSALPRAQREPRVHPVSRRLASRSLAEMRQARQVSSARPSQPRPSLPFLLWQRLLLGLPLQPLPESSCAPSRPRPRESSSSASSFP